MGWEPKRLGQYAKKAAGDEYTHPGPNGVRHLLLCRVTLGRVFYSNTKDGTRDGPVLHLVFKLRVQGVTGVTAGRCRRCM